MKILIFTFHILLLIGFAGGSYGQDTELLRQARYGDVSAQNKLGVMNFASNDYTEAYRWWKLAAENGFAPAQVNLGFLYDSGRGVPQNRLKAEEWYWKAAAQGEALAKAMLGDLYFKNGLTSSLHKESSSRCVRLGFKIDTTEHFNCLIEFLDASELASGKVQKGPNIPLQNTQPTSDFLFEILGESPQTPTEVHKWNNPVNMISRCVKIGDFSRNIVSFNSIACPPGYAPFL